MAAFSTIALIAGAAAVASKVLDKPKLPDAAPVAATSTVDPAAQQAAADTKAAQNTNAALAAKNKARKASSLLAAGDPASQEGVGSALGYGKTTLGG